MEKSELPSTPGPGKLLGAPVDRIDGRRKVTGAARYTAEYPLERLAYGFVVGSGIAAGEILAIDTQPAVRAPGVLAVITHRNALSLAPREEPVTPQNRPTRAVPVLQGTRIHHYGQHVAVVIAETYEQARFAARLVNISYRREEARLSFDAYSTDAYAPPVINANYPTDTVRGDFDAGLHAAAVSLDATYETPIELHHPLEPAAAIASWDGDQLALHHPSQIFGATMASVAATFGIPAENVHVIAPFIGGGFGCKIATRSHTILAAMAAKMLGRPVKVVLTRQQMATSVGLRQLNRQRIRLGATADGNLTALAHEILTHSSPDEEFVEQTGVMARMMYAVPNSRVTHRVFPLHLPVATWTRAPGETPGSFALEAAMDELAHALRIDPIELRLRNEPARNPENGLPWSSRSVVACMRAGAERFGWAGRPREPRARREGRWLIGHGMAASSRGAPFRPTSARVKLTLESDGPRARLELAATDLGTGSYTIIAQTAADALGLALNRIAVAIGDSRLPPTPGSGGSWGAGSFTSATDAACRNVRQQLAARAGLDAAQPLADLMRAARTPIFEATATVQPGEEARAYSSFAYGANFAEVRVDESLGIVRVKRFVAAIAAGRVLNEKTARSQVLGGIVWGISQALHERALADPRFGNFVTRDLVHYHVPAHADIPKIEVLFVPEEDRIVNPIGAKGLGEIGIISVAAAVANAVFNATGTRIRTLPITVEKLLGHASGSGFSASSSARKAPGVAGVAED